MYCPLMHRTSILYLNLGTQVDKNNKIDLHLEFYDKLITQV